MSRIHSFQTERGNLDDWLEGNSAVLGTSQENMEMMHMAPVEQVSFPVTPAAPATGRPTKNLQLADHYRTVSLPVQYETRSFVSALNSTMGPRVQREPLVIPGSKKRPSTTRMLPESKRSLHPHLRLLVVLTLITAALLFATLSLSPVGNGQVDVPVVGNFIQWAQDEQMKMNIAARHDQAPGQGTDTTTANAGPTLPKSQYVAIAQAAAAKYGISPIYFVNQIQQESHFDPYAQSNAGAVGIAQFEPATAASMGINPYDPNSALDGAARYMSQLQVQFGGDYAKALAAYNGGSGAVQAAVRNCGAGWLSCMSPQTQSYVVLIMR
jgi:hypothetical protein